MDPQVPTSFIPKKTLDTGNLHGGVHTSSSSGLIFFIALLIFIASLVAAGAAFAYNQILTQQLASKSHSLTLNEQAYDPDTIDQLMRIDSRITEAKKLLDTHVAPSAIFGFLSLQTLQNVQFTKFDYETAADGTITITLDGLADSFSTVALQSDQFGASKALKNVVFSGIGVDPVSSKVTFSVSADVDQSLLLYSNELAAGTTADTSTTDASTTQAPPVQQATSSLSSPPGTQ